MTFSGNLNADLASNSRQLTVNASGLTTFGTVGNTESLSSLTTDLAGITKLNGGGITATTLLFKDNVTVSGTPLLTATTATFERAINSAAANATPSGELTVAASGVTTFGATTTLDRPLLALISNGGGTTIFTGNLKATTITISDAVTLGGTSTLAGTDVTFGSSINADVENTRSLTVNASHSAAFNGAIGNTSDPGTIATTAAGSTVFSNGTIEAATINLQNSVTLGAAATSISGATLTFGSTLTGSNSANTLSVTSTGAASFNGTVSTFASLTTAATGTTIAKGLIDVPVQHYGNAFKASGTGTISTGTRLTAGTSVVFDSTVNGNAANQNFLQINSPVTTFGGSVGGTATLRGLETDSAGTTTFGTGATVVKATALTIKDDVRFDAATTTITGTAVTFERSVTGVGGDEILNVNAAGVTTFSGSVFNLASLITDAAGSVLVNGGGGSFTASETIAFKDPVTLNVNTTINTVTATFGKVTFGGNETIDLTVNASGVTSFNGGVGTATAGVKTLTTNDAPGADSTAIVGSIFGGTIVFNDPVTVKGTATVVPSSSLSFASTVNGLTASGQNLTLGNATSTGTSTLNDTVGATTSLKSFITAGTGALKIKTTDIKADLQNYGSPVSLEANATLTGITVTFGGNLNADLASNSRQLTVNASGLTTFGTVGNTESLSSLTTDAAGTTKLNGGGMTATTLLFKDNVTVSGTPLLTATTATFERSINSAAANTTPSGALTVTASGVTTFGGTIGFGASLLTAADDRPLLALTSNGSGTTIFKSSIRATTITISDAATLGGNSILVATDVTFGSSINADTDNTWSLTSNASHSATFNGAIGNTTPLRAFVADSAGTLSGTVALGTGTLKATTISLRDTLELTADTTLTGTTIRLQGVVGQGGTHHALTLSGSGTTTLTGNITDLTSFIVNAGGTTVFGTAGVTTLSVSSSGNQTYNDNIQVLAHTVVTLTSSGGTITYSGTVTKGSGATISPAP